MNFTTTEFIAIGVVVAVMLFEFVIRPRIASKLTMKQIELIDYACEKGVKYAEQLYLNGENIDRNKVAIDYAFDVVKKSGVLPERYTKFIKGVIESKVNDLPPTHS